LGTKHENYLRYKGIIVCDLQPGQKIASRFLGVAKIGFKNKDFMKQHQKERL
jgi:hypothetical protein